VILLPLPYFLHHTEITRRVDIDGSDRIASFTMGMDESAENDRCRFETAGAFLRLISGKWGFFYLASLL
jgi:hypothetical protein